METLCRQETPAGLRGRSLLFPPQRRDGTLHHRLRHHLVHDLGNRSKFFHRDFTNRSRILRRQPDLNVFCHAPLKNDARTQCKQNDAKNSKMLLIRSHVRQLPRPRHPVNVRAGERLIKPAPDLAARFLARRGGVFGARD